MSTNSWICLFSFKKELITSEGCVEMVIPWQLCRTIGPLISQRFPLASAKAQPRGDFDIKGIGSQKVARFVFRYVANRKLIMQSKMPLLCYLHALWGSHRCFSFICIGLYSGTLEYGHPKNVTTFLKWPLFAWPVWISLFNHLPPWSPYHTCELPANPLDEVTVFLMWPLLDRSKSGHITKVLLYFLYSMLMNFLIVNQCHRSP